MIIYLTRHLPLIDKNIDQINRTDRSFLSSSFALDIYIFHLRKWKNVHEVSTFLLVFLFFLFSLQVLYKYRKILFDEVVRFNALSVVWEKNNIYIYCHYMKVIQKNICKIHTVFFLSFLSSFFLILISRERIIHYIYIYDNVCNRKWKHTTLFYSINERKSIRVQLFRYGIKNKNLWSINFD